MIGRSLLQTMFLPAAVRARAARGLSGQQSAKSIRALVHLLNDESETVRIACLDSLVGTGAPSISVLRAELMNESSSVRSRIAEALGRFPRHADSVVPALKSCLRDRSVSVRVAAANSLAEFGPSAAGTVNELIGLVKQNEVEATRAGLKALGRIGRAALPSLPVLMASLVSDDREIRISAAQSVGSICSSAPDEYTAESVTQLTQFLFHSDATTREAAAKAIAAIGPGAKSAIPALIQQSTDRNVKTRLAVVQALVAAGQDDQRMFSALITLCQDKEWTIREIAARGFVPYGPAAKNAVPQLKRLLNDEYARVRLAAIEAVAAIGRPARFLASDVYVRLFDNNSRTRDAALGAFRDMAVQLPDFVPLVLKELTSVNPLRRLTAVQVLKEFGDNGDAISALSECLYDDSMQIREAVAAILGTPVPLGTSHSQHETRRSIAN